MNSPWHPRTLLDERALDTAMTEDAQLLRPMRCRCRRNVAPMMMRSVKDLPAGLTSMLPAGTTHLCDACEEELYASGQWDREAIAQARGAPAEHLAMIRQRVQKARQQQAADRALEARIQQDFAKGKAPVMANG